MAQGSSFTSVNNNTFFWLKKYFKYFEIFLRADLQFFLMIWIYDVSEWSQGCYQGF